MSTPPAIPRVALRPRRARAFQAGHPWVFAGAIAAVEGGPADGAEVDLVSHNGSFVARGFFNSQSKIRVRLYSRAPGIALDREFFRERLAAAIRLRESILACDLPGRACRLIFSEGDGLSGLIVDRYDRWLVVQLTSLALAQRREWFTELLIELLKPEGIYLRTEGGIAQLEGLTLRDGLLWGDAPVGPVTIQEEGIRFRVDLTQGQKTGFYLDQRQNRVRAAAYARGRRVLDAFCYTGGFSLHAARAGARQVVGIDGSESAIELARENARRNAAHSVSFVRGEVFEELARLDRNGERFGLVILDPPKFARKREAVDEALRGYRRLQTISTRLLEPDGILVSCCCSGLITMEMLMTLLGQVAAKSQRDVQILERHGQSPDHPVAVGCPETSYLKCLICRVR